MGTCACHSIHLLYSAIVNFIKFHVHMANEGQEQEEAIVSTHHLIKLHKNARSQYSWYMYILVYS